MDYFVTAINELSADIGSMKNLIWQITKSIQSSFDVDNFRRACHDVIHQSLIEPLCFPEKKLMEYFPDKDDIPLDVGEQTPDAIVINDKELTIKIYDVAVSSTDLVSNRKVKKYNAMKVFCEKGLHYDTEIIPLVVNIESSTHAIPIWLIKNPKLFESKVKVICEIWKAIRSDPECQTPLNQWFEDMESGKDPRLDIEPLSEKKKREVLINTLGDDDLYDEYFSDTMMTSADFLNNSALIYDSLREGLGDPSRPNWSHEDYHVKEKMLWEARDQYIARSKVYGFAPIKSKPVLHTPLINYYDESYNNLSVSERFHKFADSYKVETISSIDELILASVKEHSSVVKQGEKNYDVPHTFEQETILTPMGAVSITKRKIDEKYHSANKAYNKYKAMVRNMSASERSNNSVEMSLTKPQIEMLKKTRPHYVPFSMRVGRHQRINLLTKLRINSKQEHKLKKDSEDLEEKLSDPDYQFTLPPDMDTKFIDEFCDEISDYNKTKVEIRDQHGNFASGPTESYSEELMSFFKNSQLYSLCRNMAEVAMEISSNAGRSSGKSENGFFFTVTEGGVGVYVDPKGQLRKDSKSMVILFYKKNSLSKDFENGKMSRIPTMNLSVKDPIFSSHYFFVSPSDLDVWMRLDDTMTVVFSHWVSTFVSDGIEINSAFRMAMRYTAISFLIRVKNSNNIAKEFTLTRYMVMKSLSQYETPFDVIDGKFSNIIRSPLVLWLHTKIKEYLKCTKPITKIPINVHSALEPIDHLNKYSATVKTRALFTDTLVSITTLFNEVYIGNSISPNAFDKVQGSVDALVKLVNSEMLIPDEYPLNDLKSGFYAYEFDKEFLKDIDEKVSGKRHIFSSNLIESAMVYLYETRKASVSKGLKAGLRKARVDLVELATFKSMVVASPGKFTESAYSLLQSKSYDELLDTFRKENMLPIADLSSEDNISAPKMIDVTSQEKRAKVVSLVLKSIQENPTAYDSVAILVETIENDLVPLIDMFKKNQIGGVREIYIMSFHFRFSTFVSEKISEGICYELKEEFLTKGDKKYTILEKAIKDGFSSAVDKNGLLFTESSDQSEWGPNFFSSVFAPIFKVLRSEGIPNLCDTIICWLLKKTEKVFEVPSSVTRSWNENPNLHSGTEAMTRMKKNCMAKGTPLVSNKSNMGQGIDHYSSSLLHVLLVITFYKVYEYYCVDHGLDYNVVAQVSSDDRGLSIAIWKLSGEGFSDDEAFTIINDFRIIIKKISLLFCVLPNFVKTVLNNFILEFNSRFQFLTHGVEPAIKQSYRSCSIPRGLSFKSWVESLYSDVRGLRESGASGVTCLIAHKLNKRFTEKFFQTEKGARNNVADALGLQDANGTIPFAYGVYPILPPCFSEALGPRFYDFLCYEKSYVGRIFLNSLVDYKTIQPEETMEDFGVLNYPKFKTLVPSQLKMVRSQLSNYEEFLKDPDVDPFCLLTSSRDDRKEVREMKLSLKLKGSGAILAYSDFNIAVHISRLRAIILSNSVTVPSVEGKVTFLEGILKSLTSRDNSLYLDRFYFMFLDVFKSASRLESIVTSQKKTLDLSLPLRRQRLMISNQRSALPVPTLIALKDHFDQPLNNLDLYSGSDIRRTRALLENILQGIPKTLEGLADYMKIPVPLALKAIANYIDVKQSLSIVLNTRLDSRKLEPLHLLMVDQIDGSLVNDIPESLVRSISPMFTDLSFVRDMMEHLSLKTGLSNAQLSDYISTLNHSGTVVTEKIRDIITHPPKNLDHNVVCFLSTLGFVIGLDTLSVTNFIKRYPSPPFIHDEGDLTFSSIRTGNSSVSIAKAKGTQQLLPLIYGNCGKQDFFKLLGRLGMLTSFCSVEIPPGARMAFKYDMVSRKAHDSLNRPGQQLYFVDPIELKPRHYIGLRHSIDVVDDKIFMTTTNQYGVILLRSSLRVITPRRINLISFNPLSPSPDDTLISDIIPTKTLLNPGASFSNFAQYASTFPQEELTVTFFSNNPRKQIYKTICGSNGLSVNIKAELYNFTQENKVIMTVVDDEIQQVDDVLSPRIGPHVRESPVSSSESAKWSSETDEDDDFDWDAVKTKPMNLEIDLTLNDIFGSNLENLNNIIEQSQALTMAEPQEEIIPGLDTMDISYLELGKLKKSEYLSTLKVEDLSLEMILAHKTLGLFNIAKPAIIQLSEAEYISILRILARYSQELNRLAYQREASRCRTLKLRNCIITLINNLIRLEANGDITIIPGNVVNEVSLSSALRSNTKDVRSEMPLTIEESEYLYSNGLHSDYDIFHKMVISNHLFNLNPQYLSVASLRTLVSNPKYTGKLHHTIDECLRASDSSYLFSNTVKWDEDVSEF